MGIGECSLLLESILVQPETATVEVGEKLTLTAKGIQSDGTIVNMGGQVTWYSADSLVVKVEAARGVIEGVTAGLTTVTASVQTQDGFKEGRASVLVTGTGSTFSSIAVTPSNPSVSVNATQQFTATGTYSDGSTTDLTSTATWVSSNPNITTVNSSGLATGVAAGNVTITATSQGFSGTTTLTVTVVIDHTAPAAPTISGISSGTYSTSQSFTVSGENGATIEYSLDGGSAWTNYSSEVTLTSDGNYPITARQTDAAGNVSSNAATITVVIDKTPPATPTISGISSGTYSTSQSFTVSGEGGATIEYSLNGGSTWTNYSSAVTLTSDGSYPITARQTDAAGNVSSNAATITVVIDTTAADEWDSSYKGPSIALSNSDKSATSNNNVPSHSWNSVYAKNSVSSGIRTWEVTITSYYDSASNSWELVIGVGHTRNSNTTTYCPSQGRSYGYISENGGKSNSGQSTPYGSNYGKDDVIKVVLDMSTGYLTFYKNNISQGVAYAVDTSKTYYLVTSIGNNGTMVEITNTRHEDD